MQPLRIYADFNGLVGGPRNPAATAVVLDTYGSVRDLANAGVVLTVGMPLIGVDWSDEAEDLEGHGTAQYDAAHRWWVIEFDSEGVRYVPAGDRTPVKQHLCVGCRKDIPTPRGVPRCPTCGVSVDASIAPPPESS